MFTAPNHPLRVLADGLTLASFLPKAETLGFDLSKGKSRALPVLERVTRRVTTIWRDQKAQMAARRLEVLDDRILGDIGFSRGQIGAAMHGGRVVLPR